MEIYTPDLLLIHINIVDSLRHVDMITNFLHELSDRVYKMNRKPPLGEILLGWSKLIELNYGLEKIPFPNYNHTKILHQASGLIFLYKMICPLEQTELMVKTIHKVLKLNKHILDFEIYIGKDYDGE